jgi:hypothetical protein
VPVALVFAPELALPPSLPSFRIRSYAEVLNSLPGASLSNIAVGDFDGDGRSDLLFADGTNWYISSEAPVRSTS